MCPFRAFRRCHTLGITSILAPVSALNFPELRKFASGRIQ
jgi:hypothetical protein